jgi:hypothetical protein
MIYILSFFASSGSRSLLPNTESPFRAVPWQSPMDIVAEKGEYSCSTLCEQVSLLAFDPQENNNTRANDDLEVKDEWWVAETTSS